MARPFHTVCSKCGKAKHLYSLIVDGVERARSRCMPCHAARSYASRVKNKATHADKVRQRLEASIERRAYVVWKRAKDRAAKRSIVFDLPQETVATWLRAGKCAATGLVLDMKFAAKKLNPLAPSLDRIDPAYGYTPKNTRMVCWIFNRAKGDGTDADVQLLVEALYAVKVRSAA